MADKKPTQLTALSALSSGDLFYGVDDPTGTPLDRKVTIDVIASYIRLNPSNISALSSDVTSIIGTTPGIALFTDNSSHHGMGIIGNGAHATGTSLDIMKTRSTGTNNTADTIVSTNDVLAQINFWGADGVVYRRAGFIQCAVHGIPGAADMPGAISIWTTPDGSVTPAQNLTVTREGNTLLGTTTDPTGTATKVLVFGDNAGAPNPGTNCAALYATDVAGTVEMFAVDEAGNDQQLTSHANLNAAEAAGIVLEPADLAPWVNWTRNHYTGVEVFRYTGPSGVTQLKQIQRRPTANWETVQDEMEKRNKDAIERHPKLMDEFRILTAFVLAEREKMKAAGLNPEFLPLPIEPAVAQAVYPQTSTSLEIAMSRKLMIISIPFPIKGFDESTAYQDQPELTCREMLNMRPIDPQTGRARGAQRGGIAKYISTALTGGVVIQDLNQVTSISTASASPTAMQIRSIKGMAVGGGDVYLFTAPSTLTLATAGNNALDPNASVIFSAEHQGIIYFADGVNYKKWTASTNTVAAWAATSGTIPAVAAEKPRLIEQWRGRIVLAGIKTDPHNWFMSKKDDPLNWNYAPSPINESQATAGNNSPAGYVGEPITAIIPYNDDICIFGADHSIWMMDGDPMAGGRLIRQSGITGIAWGRAWCHAPNGVIYFFGSRGGVYRMIPGQEPERLSGKRLDSRMAVIDLDDTIVRMAWNDQEQGVHVMLTPLNTNTAIHYWYDARTDSWCRDRFYNESHSPVAMHVYDGDSPDDRRVLMGGKDGYIRYWTPNTLTDDGTAIDSQVLLGPIQVRNEQGSFLPFILTELQATLAEDSPSVTANVFVGNSAEAAFAVSTNPPGFLIQEATGRIVLQDGTGFLQLQGDNVDYSDTFSPVRSASFYPRQRAYAAYIRLRASENNTRWAYENVQAKLSVITSSKRRIS